MEIEDNKNDIFKELRQKKRKENQPTNLEFYIKRKYPPNITMK